MGGIDGDVMATSLHVVVLSPEGQTVFEGRGGFDFIQEMDMSAARNFRWELRMRKGAVDDSEVLREGIRIALGPYLPPRSGR